jgi:hypothetical protein
MAVASQYRRRYHIALFIEPITGIRRCTTNATAEAYKTTRLEDDLMFYCLFSFLLERAVASQYKRQSYIALFIEPITGIRRCTTNATAENYKTTRLEDDLLFYCLFTFLLERAVASQYKRRSYIALFIEPITGIRCCTTNATAENYKTTRRFVVSRIWRLQQK